MREMAEYNHGGFKGSRLSGKTCTSLGGTIDMRNLEMNPDYRRAVIALRMGVLHKKIALNCARHGDKKTCARYMDSSLHWVMQANKLFKRVREQIIV